MPKIARKRVAKSSGRPFEEENKSRGSVKGTAFS
jgi:hypothetical protein